MRYIMWRYAKAEIWSERNGKNTSLQQLAKKRKHPKIYRQITSKQEKEGAVMNEILTHCFN